MSQTSVRIVARCDDCQKVYRVPDSDRAYACKACGGTVQAMDGAEGAAFGEGRLVLCSDCQTLNPPEAEQCAECDADLAGAEIVESAEEAADLLDEAKSAFKLATPRGRAVAWIYHFGALAYAVAALFAVLALRQPEVPLAGGVLVVVLTTLLSILMGTAALHLLFHPFRWTLAVALLATAVACIHAVGPNPLGLALLGSAAWAILSWILLVPVRKFDSLIERHKDLYILHHASQETKRSLRGRLPGERHRRLMRAMRRADRKAWKISAVAAVALVGAVALGSSLVVRGGRPQTLDDAVASFEAAWNGGRADKLESLYDERVRAIESTWISAVTQGHGWAAELPTLPEGSRRMESSRAYVDYEVQGLPLTACFVLDDLRWRLTKLELPYPEIDPVLERFQEAWRASDPAALAEFFSPENRAARRETLEESKLRREWVVFPEILETDLKPDGERRYIAQMKLEEGELKTKWFFRDDGQWGVYGLEMPTIRYRASADEPPPDAEDS